MFRYLFFTTLSLISLMIAVLVGVLPLMLIPVAAAAGCPEIPASVVMKYIAIVITGGFVGGFFMVCREK